MQARITTREEKAQGVERYRMISGEMPSLVASRSDATQSTLVCIVSPGVSSEFPTRAYSPCSAFPSIVTNSKSRRVINNTHCSRKIKISSFAHIETPPPKSQTRRNSTGQQLNCVPEDAEISVQQMQYGSTPVTPYRQSLTLENEEDMSEDEEEYLLDEELARSGLYRGNYNNILLLYTIVPITTLLAFVLLALLPVLAFPSSASSSFPYPPSLPYPLPEILTAASFWSLSHLLRSFLFEASVFLTSWIPPTPRYLKQFLTLPLTAILQNTSTLVLQQLTVPILLIPMYSTERPFYHNGGLYTLHQNFPSWEDVAFKRIWWIALGWAAAEAVVGIKQGYENIALYKDVVVSVRKTVREETSIVNPPIDQIAGSSSHARSSHQRIKTPLADREVYDNSDFLRGRDRSHSLSSNASGGSYGGDLATPVVHERQPLLTRRQQTENIAPAIGLGIVPQDADRAMVEGVMEQDFYELVSIKSREEIEELYGMPIIKIPVFISCLHRINSILASLAVYLTLTAAYMRSKFAYDYSQGGLLLTTFRLPLPSSVPLRTPSLSSNDIGHPFTPSNRALILSFTMLLGVQTAFSILHSPWILPRIGVHTFVYVSLLVWLGLFFGALGIWQALA